MTEPKEHKSKPVVFYRGTPQIIHIGDGQRYANLYALNHPKLGRTDVRTSLIVNMSDGGIIETLNTFYEPVNEEML